MSGTRRNETESSREATVKFGDIENVVNELRGDWEDPDQDELYPHNTPYGHESEWA